MFRIATLTLIIFGMTASAEEKPNVTVSSCKAFSLKGAKVDLVWNGKPVETPTVSITDLTMTTPLPRTGPYNVYLTPKGGVKVEVLDAFPIKAGNNVLQLADHLGTAIVLGDDLPRVEAIVLTAESDPGPGEKGHAAVQRAADYKDDLIAPAGFYSVWIVPANGTKAQRIADRIRVQAGRETRVGE